MRGTSRSSWGLTQIVVSAWVTSDLGHNSHSQQQAAGSPVLWFVSHCVKTDAWICFFSSNTYIHLLLFFLLLRQLLFLIAVLFVWMHTTGQLNPSAWASPWDLPDKFKSKPNIPRLLLLLSLKNYVVSSSFFSLTHLVSLPGGRVGGVCLFKCFSWCSGDYFSVPYDVLLFCGSVGVWELLWQECWAQM